jgi:hypothetical protein
MLCKRVQSSISDTAALSNLGFWCAGIFSSRRTGLALTQVSVSRKPRPSCLRLSLNTAVTSSPTTTSRPDHRPVHTMFANGMQYGSCTTEAMVRELKPGIKRESYCTICHAPYCQVAATHN